MAVLQRFNIFLFFIVMTRVTYFSLGSVVGAYIAQNYNIPIVKDEIEKIIIYLKSLEK
tara:strand:- start:3334 stop:3507 length:174 start_codon:yes stop_codon:yes gene_type:complete